MPMRPGQRQPGEALEDINRRADRDALVELKDILIEHADAAVAHGVADRSLFIRAVNQIAVADLELPGAEHIRDLPLIRAHRRNEDLAVKDDFDTRAERPEIADRVDPPDVII